MTADALQIYEDQLSEILGEEGHFTESALFDPSGDDEATIYGIFDHNSNKGQKDSGNAKQKISDPHFIVKESPFAQTKDVYQNKIITIRDEDYIIYYVSFDKTGAQVLWLRL